MTTTQNFMRRALMGACLALMAALPALAQGVDLIDVIPDANFRFYLMSYAYQDDKAAIDKAIADGTYVPTKTGNPFYKDNNWTPADFAIITKLVPGSNANFYNNRKISDFTGIEYFPNLATLNVSYHTFTTLDVSHNYSLQTLLCNYTSVEALDLRQNNELKSLSCQGNNQLTSIDASGLEKLQTATVSGNNALTNINLSGDIQLEKLTIDRDNSLTSIDVSGLVGLVSFSANNNTNLTNINFNGAVNLNSITVLNSNRLTNLDASGLSLTSITFANIVYEHVDVSNNQLESLNAIRCKDLNVSRNKLSRNAIYTRLNASQGDGTYLLKLYDDTHGDEGNFRPDNALATQALNCGWKVQIFDGTEWVDYVVTETVSLDEFPCDAFKWWIRNYMYANNKTAFDNARTKGTFTRVTPEGGTNPFSDATDLTYAEIALVTDINLYEVLMSSRRDANGYGNLDDLTGIEYFFNLKNLILSSSPTQGNGYDLTSRVTSVDLSNAYQLNMVDAVGGVLTDIQFESTNAITFYLSHNGLTLEQIDRLAQQAMAAKIGLTLRIYDDKNTTDPETNAKISKGTKITYSQQRINCYYYNRNNDWSKTSYHNTSYWATFQGDADDLIYIGANDNRTFADPILRWYIRDVAYIDNKKIIDQAVARGELVPRGSEGTTYNPYYYNDYITPHEASYIRELRLNNWTHPATVIRDNNGSEVAYNRPARYITSLEGIQRLDSLEHLYVQGHGLTDIDVSGMKKLRILHCQEQMNVTRGSQDSETGEYSFETSSDGGLQTLNVQGCDSLFQIYCDHNLLTELDVSTCGNMKELRCNNNPLGDNGLDVTRNPHMIWLDCYNCNLAELDVTHNTVLERLYCYETRDGEASGTPRRGRITNLNLSNNPKLWELRISNLPLADLDLSHNTDLKILYANNMDLSGGKLNGNLPALKKLQELSCYADTLDALDVSGNTALRKLYCYNNQIPTLDLSSHSDLQVLVCGDNQTGVDERDVPLPSGGNRLTTLDLSNNRNLTTLRCAKNNLVELDLSEQPLLAELNYEEQTRDIEALFTLTREDKTLYYLRMDEDTNDEGGPLLNEMARTDHAGTSLFDISRVDMASWTHNCELYSGTFVPEEDSASGAPRRVAPTTATADDLIRKYVIGDILILTPDDVTGNDTDGYTATGYVEYKYNTRLHDDAPVTDPVSNFHLNWSTQPSDEPDLITGVGEVKGATDVVSVTYCNLAGMTSDRPFEGVNIVTTRHSDGTVTTTKVVFK